MAVYKDGKFEVELPPFSQKIVDLADAYIEKTASKDIFKAQYDFVVATLPPDYIKDVLGSDKFEECDVTLITVLYTKVKIAYEEASSKLLDAKNLLDEVQKSRQRFSNRK